MIVLNFDPQRIFILKVLNFLIDLSDSFEILFVENVLDDAIKTS